MKCFVTGATGFVGGHLCERLIGDGHTVRALARKTSNRSLLESCGAEVVEGDLNARPVLVEEARNADIVFHLAAITRGIRTMDYYDINTGGTLSLAKALRKGKFSGRVVYLSSLAASGPASDVEHLRAEDDPPEPVSHYGESKLRGERHLREILPEDATLSVLRPGPIYGPREQQIFQVLKILKKTGVAFRIGRGVTVQMTHVEDVVDALARAGTMDAAAGETYHCVNREAWNFEEFMDLAGDVLGRKVRVLPLPMIAGKMVAGVYDGASWLAGRALSPLTADKLREMAAGYWLGNPSKTEQQLHWKARWTLPEGMKETIEWYKKEGMI